MEADSAYEGVEGVSEPRIKLIRRGGEWGRRDLEVFDRILQAFPVGLVPHVSGGGRASVGAARRMSMGTWSDLVEGRVVASQDYKAGRMRGLAKARSIALGLKVPERGNLV